MRALLMAIALALASSGCTSAKLKSHEATAAADVHTGATILAGVAAAAEQNPDALLEAIHVGSVLLQKSGVPQATAAKIATGLRLANPTAVKEAALELAAATAPSQ